jgi:hypothetical protein
VEDYIDLKAQLFRTLPLLCPKLLHPLSLLLPLSSDEGASAALAIGAIGLVWMVSAQEVCNQLGRLLRRLLPFRPHGPRTSSCSFPLGGCPFRLDLLCGCGSRLRNRLRLFLP